MSNGHYVKEMSGVEGNSKCETLALREYVLMVTRFTTIKMT